VDVLPLVFSTGWASGVNAYLVVLLAGLLGRYGGVEGIPPALERTDVLVVAAVLFAVEFVADKIPYLDSAWDAVSTFVRPVVGAALGILIAGESGDLNEVVGGLVGGGTALASHSVKAGFRLGVNTSPEPVSNIGTSVVEDGLVATVVLLAIDHPWLAAGVAAVLLVSGSVLIVLLWRKIRQAFRAVRARFSGPPASGPPASGPAPPVA
jgi:hypothetical protein